MKKAVAFTVIFVVVAVIILPTVAVYSLGGPAGTRPTQLFRGEDITVRVYIAEESRIVEMSLEDYVKGVVAAEMPAEFELEALKSQAVAARTYAAKNMTLFGGSGLADQPNADVSTDPHQGQAWVSSTQLRNRWGTLNYDRYWNKVSRAVDETRGLVVIYNGEMINAVFHSTSGDRTASAKEVWGFDYPYLKSVTCTWDKKSPRYSDNKEYTLTELEQRLGPDAGVIAAAQTGNSSIAQIIDRTESGRVDKIRLGSQTLSGQSLRQKLDLRSTNFSMDIRGDKIVFKTIGYGHGVGLCQYGANGMAKEGQDFRQILTYYYTGVAIKNIFGS
ncbi:MAG: stage II sporulation protein D [Negativicutes bacterium]|nr:stage II sporulation protein D [Negativicutes bacterium]